jgi:hypothetical protein
MFIVEIRKNLYVPLFAPDFLTTEVNALEADREHGNIREIAVRCVNACEN